MRAEITSPLTGPWPGIAELVALVGFDAAQLACVLRLESDQAGRVDDDALAVADQIDRRSLRTLCRYGVLALRSHDEPAPFWSLAWPDPPRPCPSTRTETRTRTRKGAARAV